MTRCPIVPVTLIALLSACSREPPPPASSTPSPASATPAAAGAASSALDALDPRAPVPLLPMMADHQKRNMRDHLVAVQQIVSAIGSDDFAAVESAAARIGFSEQMGNMCTHMGAGAPGFAEQAIAFHHTADEIGLVAKRRDRGGVTKALDATLKACTSCHAAWKQQVVDEATWQRLTSTAPPRPSDAHRAHP